jgi:hypothetical protein
MADGGSRLKILSIDPYYMTLPDEGTRMPKDANGHQWPTYHYVRGRVSDITGTDVVVANPARRILLDFPDLATFL